MTDSAPRCPLSNLPCQPGCAWCRKSVNADGAVTFRCAVLVGANALHRIASDLHRQKSTYDAVLAAIAKTSEPAPAPKRVRYSEDTLQPDTTPPSVCVPHIQGDPGKRTDDYHDNGDVAGAAMRQAAGRKGTDASPWKQPPKKPHLPQLVTYGGDWDAVELVDAYRAMTERAKGKTLTCSVCGKPFTKTTKGRDPKTCGRQQCVKALRKRHQAKSLARTAAKKADAI